MIAAWLTLGAVEVSTTTPGWSVFTQYSVLGVSVFVLGWLALQNLRSERARADRERERNAALEALIRDQITPVIRDNVTALANMNQVLQQLQLDQRRSRG